MQIQSGVETVEVGGVKGGLPIFKFGCTVPKRAKKKGSKV